MQGCDAAYFLVHSMGADDDFAAQDRRHASVFASAAEHTASIEYVDPIRDLTATGFVQRHVLRLTFADGRVAELPIAIFAAVRDGQVTRIDEYVDSAHVAAAFAG